MKLNIESLLFLAGKFPLPPRTWWPLIAAAPMMFLASCANLQTVNRSSQLATTSNVNGVAVHLDAQQRLVISTAEGFCAEPSPDALAAYASALGFGISNPSKQAASLSNAFSGSAGSIGLRTQSITLMRDALYRLCEAELNGAIGGLQMAHLLTRSQDLTAVVLAIEQLTGAVVASQVVLSPSSDSSSTAMLVANQKLLESARKTEDDLKTKVEDASSAVTKADEDKKATALALAARRAELAKLEAADPQVPAEVEAKKAEVKEAETADTTAEKALAEASKKEDSTKQSLAEATTNREAIEAARDSALASTNASVSGEGNFHTPISTTKLDAESTTAISVAVSGMVAAALGKDYVVENCMALLVKGPPELASEDALSQKRYTGESNVYSMCLDVISRSLQKAMAP